MIFGINFVTLSGVLMIYSFPIFFLIISNWLSFARSRSVHLIALIAFMPFVIFVAGFRYYSDTDYIPYVEIFNSLPVLFDFTIEVAKETYGEVGFLLLNSLVKTLGMPFFVVTILAALFSITAKTYFAFKYSSSAFIVLTLYFCLHFVTTEFSELRWSIATGFILLGYNSFLKKNITFAIIFFMVAISFHYSAIMAIFILLGLLIASNRFWLCVFFVSLVVAIVFKSYPIQVYLNLGVDLYAFERLQRYLNDPSSNVGLFSILKVSLYPLAYCALGKFISRSGSDTSLYSSHILLERLSLIYISTALVCSFVPIFFLRLAPLVDFLSILVLVLYIDRIPSHVLRVYLKLVCTILFGAWYCISLSKSLLVPMEEGGLGLYRSIFETY